MNPGDVVIAIRNAVHAAILAKQLATGFINNNTFDLQKTWRPVTSLETLKQDLTSGRVYVLASAIGDLQNLSRSNMVQGMHPVTVGFQKPLASNDAVTEIDTNVKFVGELADVCRLEVDSNLADSFSSLEFLRDAENTPYSFIMLRQADVFEAYFTVYYSLPLGGYEWLTTTTTT